MFLRSIKRAFLTAQDVLKRRDSTSQEMSTHLLQGMPKPLKGFNNICSAEYKALDTWRVKPVGVLLDTHGVANGPSSAVVKDSLEGFLVAKLSVSVSLPFPQHAMS